MCIWLETLGEEGKFDFGICRVWREFQCTFCVFNDLALPIQIHPPARFSHVHSPHKLQVSIRESGMVDSIYRSVVYSAKEGKIRGCVHFSALWGLSGWSPARTLRV